LENQYVLLDYYQVMALLIEIQNLKQNPYFKDGICDSFAQDVLDRSSEIAMTKIRFPKLAEKFFPNIYKYKVFYSKFNYITRLTQIDVFDEETMNIYIPLVQAMEEEAFREIESQNPEILVKKR